MADCSAEDSHDTTVSDSTDTELPILDLEDKDDIRGDLEEARIRIEQLKHDNLILQQWKTEVGMVAVETANTLNSQIEIVEQSSQQYQLELEGIQLENQSMSQQIKAYRDEIDKLQNERPKLEAQIADLETQLNDQYLITASITAKDEEIAAHKLSLESTKLSLQNCRLELKTLRKENEDIRGENEQYQLVIQQHEDQQTKLEQQLVDRQREIAAVKMKYSEISAKLQRETVETRQQLRAAEQVASGLSDQLKEIESYQNAQNSVRTHLAPNDGRNDLMPCGMPLFEKRKTLLIKEDEQSLKLPAMMSNRSMDMSDMLESMDVATAGGGGNTTGTTPLAGSVNVSRRASMRSNNTMMSMDFSDEELMELRDRAGTAGSAGSASQNGIARRLSSLRRLAPVNEFNDSGDEKTVIVRRPSAAMSTLTTFDDEKEDQHRHNGRRRGISVPSSVCDSEEDRMSMERVRGHTMGYDEFQNILRRRETRDDEEEGTKTRRRGFTSGDVKEIRINIAGNGPHGLNATTGMRSRSRSRSRSRLSPRDISSDEDEVDKLLKRQFGASFNKYRGNNKVVSMDPETRDNLKGAIIEHIDRLKREYERQQEAEKLAHRRQVNLWEEKYRSLKRDHKKMKNVHRRQKAKDLSVAPNCTTFWNWGRQSKGCVPLKQPPAHGHRGNRAVKARPYRSGQSKSRKAMRRIPKKRRKRNEVVADKEKKEESDGKV